LIELFFENVHIYESINGYDRKVGSITLHICYPPLVKRLYW